MYEGNLTRRTYEMLLWRTYEMLLWARTGDETVIRLRFDLYTCKKNIIIQYLLKEEIPISTY